MWTTFSVSRWICLLTLAVVMLFSASEVDSFIEIPLSCCPKDSLGKIKEIQACYEQKPREGCNHHAFLIISGGRQWCVSPKAKWLKAKRQKGEVDCPSVLSLKGVQEVDVV